MPRVCNTLTITNTTAQNLLPAGADLVNVLKSVQYQNTNGVATLLNIIVGASTLATISVAANMANPVSLEFGYPLVSLRNQAIQVQAVTTGANILFNFQGESVIRVKP